MSISGTAFGNAANDYRAFRAGFPQSIFERLALFDLGMQGQIIVDLGTGTGTLARGFARRGCDVIGIDVDDRMIAQAIELDQQEGIRTRYVQSSAERTGLASSSVDVVSAGQCWHWFDRQRVAAEVLRILKPRASLVIAHFDWLPIEGTVVEATERLIEQHNPDWHLGGGRGIYPQWLPGLSVAGFIGIETFSYDVDVSYTPEAWRGRIRASAGIAALEANAALNFDSDLKNLLSARFPAEVLSIPHRVFAIVAGSP